MKKGKLGINEKMLGVEEIPLVHKAKAKCFSTRFLYGKKKLKFWASLTKNGMQKKTSKQKPWVG